MAGHYAPALEELTACRLVPGLAWAQADSATAAQQKPLPPSANPAQRVVYAGEGQTNEQQMADQLACYCYATEQTTWDPHEAYAVLEQKHGEALKQYEQTQGGAVRGAAGRAGGAFLSSARARENCQPLPQLSLVRRARGAE